MSAQQVHPAPPAGAAAPNTDAARATPHHAPKAAETPRIPKLELFWMLFVFPSLLFLSICVLTQQHTGHKFRHSVRYVLLGLQHDEVWPWVLVGAGVGVFRCRVSAVCDASHTCFPRIDRSLALVLSPERPHSFTICALFLFPRHPHC